MRCRERNTIVLQSITSKYKLTVVPFKLFPFLSPFDTVMTLNSDSYEDSKPEVFVVALHLLANEN